jgi:hypothetical protein
MQTYTVSDPKFLDAIEKSKDGLELRDPTGSYLGRVEKEWLGKLPPGLKSPLSDEEFEERKKDPDEGRTLLEILADLERRSK